MILRGGGRQADDRAFDVCPPVRRAESHKGGHEIHAAVIRRLPAASSFGFLRRRDQAQLVAQPGDRRAGEIDDALEGIRRADLW